MPLLDGRVEGVQVPQRTPLSFAALMPHSADADECDTHVRLMEPYLHLCLVCSFGLPLPFLELGQ